MSEPMAVQPHEYPIIKRQQAKLRAGIADWLYENSEPNESSARRIDEEAHALALPANEEPISTQEEM